MPAGIASGNPPYRRVMLKLSGEALMGDADYGIDFETVGRIADDIKQVLALGVEVAVVVGGGEASADYMGMLATVINALALQNALEERDVVARVQSAIPMASVCEPYIRRRAMRHLELGRAVIFAAGTGNPFFTTDTSAALRAAETGCEVLLKGTQVDGVYSDDPIKNPAATRYDELTFHEVLARDLKVMDAAAISLARENQIPILVFSIHLAGAFAEVVLGRGQRTIIRGD